MKTFQRDLQCKLLFFLLKKLPEVVVLAILSIIVILLKASLVANTFSMASLEFNYLCNDYRFFFYFSIYPYFYI